MVVGEGMVVRDVGMGGCDVGHDGIVGGRARLNGGMGEDGDGGRGDGELLELILDMVVQVGGAREQKVDRDAACFFVDGFATFGGGDDVCSIEEHRNAHDAAKRGGIRVCVRVFGLGIEEPKGEGCVKRIQGREGNGGWRL